jgi:O-antigen/teichoic acid export membrane protein
MYHNLWPRGFARKVARFHFASGGDRQKISYISGSISAPRIECTQVHSPQDIHRMFMKQTNSVPRMREDNNGVIAEQSPEIPKELGRAVGRGITAMAISTIANRGVALGAQAILGYLLTQADFGVFAIATAAATMGQAFRDGGMRTVLIQRGTKQYETLSGPIFWMSLACNALACALLAAASPVLARLYSEPRLFWILLVLAGLMPAGTPLLMFESKLRVDLKFDLLAKIAVYSSFGRYGVTIGSALLGAGPLSMVYGMIAATAVETAMCYRAAPDAPWRKQPRIASWGTLFQEGKWTILQVLGASLVYYGAYLPMGLVVDSSVVGVYFFAFSIVSITGHLLLTNVDAVMFPSVARLAEFPERRRQAMFRAVRGIILTCTPLSLMVGVVYAPLQRLVWPKGQWDTSVTAVQIMAFTYPLFMLHVIPRTVLTSAGRFRQAAALMILLGLGLMVAATLGAWVGGTATAIAIFTGIYTSAAGLLASCIVMKAHGVPYATTLKAVLPIWATLSCAALAVVMIDMHLWSRLPSLMRIIFSTALAGTAFLALSRACFKDSVSDVLGILPGKVARIARVLLVAREAGQES